MVELQKELSIKEIKYKIKELEDDLDLYLTLKKINFEKTQPQSTKYKDIVTNKTNQCFDKFSHYVIKDEDYDNTIYAKTEALNAWEKRLIEKIRGLSTGDSKAFITYLREEENYSWEKIEETTHYSKRQAQRIYKN